VFRPDKRLPRPATRAAVIDELIRCGLLGSERDLEARPEVAVEAQRLWHREAHQGCNFATLMSQADDRLGGDLRERFGWVTLPVTSQPTGNPDDDLLDEIEEELAALIDQPAVHAVSVLFPLLTDPWDLVRLVRGIGSRPPWELDTNAGNASLAGRVHLGIRRRLPGGELAYVLGFAPIDFLPPTRRAPFTELAFVAKPIGARERQRPELIKADPSVGHLAYMPVDIEPDEVFSAKWTSTGTLRKRRLEPEPTLVEGAKAKVTFAVPPELWS
jgi:hypothetical protein